MWQKGGPTCAGSAVASACGTHCTHVPGCTAAGRSGVAAGAGCCSAEGSSGALEGGCGRCGCPVGGGGGGRGARFD